MAFVHLHLHTEYSLLDGACRIKDLAKYVKGLGQEAVAITDHGVMYGAVDFYRACKAEGIKPIIGCEVYVAPNSRFDRVHERDSASRHLVLLCKDQEGYRNLSYLVSMAFIEGFYIKPRIDMELLRQHCGGLIALSACLSGEIPRRLLNGDYEGAKQFAVEMDQLFGRGNFYLELQDHGLEEEQTVIAGILRLHRETDIPLVVTNDAHYLRREDAEMQDILMCIQMGKLVDDPDRMKFESDQSYVKSEEEMRALFPQWPEAADNTAVIAEQCQVDFEFGNYHLPHFDCPEGYDADSYFEKLCQEGFQRRYPDAPEEYRQRLKSEQAVIRKMGFVDYFLIVSDFIAYAKSHAIPVGPGRGSAAGSMVSYCMNITDIDPMKYSLYFERFLNPERISMPDIDIDFCYQRRGEVIDYVNRKYGTDHVAQIVTFGTMAARGAIRDVGRVLNFPYAEVDVLAKQVPGGPGNLHITLEEALRLSKQLRDSYEGDPRIRKLIDTAMAIEGMPRNASTHAAGVVITSRPVYEYVPLAKNDESVVTQYVMTTLEELGLLKMDFLGLRNLTVLDDTVKMVRQERPSFSLADIPDNDPATMKMLSEGRTSGVFQMESAGMTGVCISLKPKDIEDITAIIALYRPGPMDSIPRFIACKHDPGKIKYRHPMLEPILSNTYGCIVYQEQVIEIFRRLAGYSLGQADMVRRAMSKKKRKEIERERQFFIHGDPDRGIAGCVANGIPEETAQAIYEEIDAFAEYAFNKAHAVCYAVVAYQTAWFKCHYPKEYMAALLTSVLDSTDKVAEYIGECRESGIPLLPPDINESDASFTVYQGHIRFGLAAVKGVGRGFIRAVRQERERSGAFTSFPDFCRRMLGADLNRRVLENLIKCGAFDSLGYKRSQLLQVFGQVLDSIVESQRKNLEGQFDLFGGGGSAAAEPEMVLPDIEEYPAQDLMAMEKETTGLYLSGHPMDAYRDFVRRQGAVTIGSILADFSGEGGPRQYADEQQVTIAGVISAHKTKTTRNQTLMAYVTLEDDTGSMELLVFSRVLGESGSYLKNNFPILVTGKISVREDKAPQILCDRIRPLNGAGFDVMTGGGQGVPNEKICKGEKLYIRISRSDDPRLRKTAAILDMFPGEQQAVVYFADSGKRWGTPCGLYRTMVEELRSLLGQENVVIK